MKPTTRRLATLSMILVAAGMLASTLAIRAETSNPQPGLDGVTVRLCAEGGDLGDIYCDGEGEVLASQTATTRTYPGYPISLPGTFKFTNAELSQTNLPRAVVFGPISGVYQSYASAWIWGYLFKNNQIGAPVNGVPTELFASALGSPGAGLAASTTGTVMREYAFAPLVNFYQTPHYVVVYLDQSLPGGTANPGIGTPNTLDGQVWGYQFAPPQ